MLSFKHIYLAPDNITQFVPLSVHLNGDSKYIIKAHKIKEKNDSYIITECTIVVKDLSLCKQLHEFRMS